MNSLLKNIIILFAVSCSLTACAMGGRSTKERKEQDKMWHFCTVEEMKYHDNKDPKGYICSQRCTNYKRGRCKYWDRRIKNIMNQDDYNFFTNGTFIIIDEDQIK